MKKLLNCAIILLMFCLALAADIPVDARIWPDQDTFPSEAMPAVRASLSQFLGKIPSNDMADYGFSNFGEISQAWAGLPLKLYELDSQKVLSFHKGSSLGELLRPTREWFVPVMVGSQIKAMLRLQEDEDSEPRGVSFGYIPLAGQLQQALDLPELQGFGQPALIISYQAQEFFLAFPGAKAEYLYPLSAIEAQAQAADLDRQIERIKAVISRNRKQGY
ncbi:MAG: hypothetical protein PHR32_08010 [Candidatus Cloacimonetes bacterium]|nr:hypothetical protein [Candidatus Cloacimonadota bacterium]